MEITTSENFQKLNSVLSFSEYESISKMTVQEFPKILSIYSEKFEQSKIFEFFLPKEFTTNEQLDRITEGIVYSKNKNDLESLNYGITQPTYELLQRGGKRIRPVLCFLIAECFGKSWESVKEIAGVCEIIHNATLLVDDVEDDSELRREKPCVHKLFGVDVTINAGNFLYFSAFQQLFSRNLYSKEILFGLTQVYLEEMVNLHLGQAWDIVWHNQKQKRVPTNENYLQMVSYKTGILLRVSARMTSIVLGLDKEIEKKLGVFAERVGLAFQIQDDILNLVGEEFKKGKGYSGEDIHEGKMTLMVIYALNNLEQQKDKDRLKEILTMKTQDQKLIDEAIALIKKSNGIEYSQKIASDLINNAWIDIEPFLPKNNFKTLLHFFAQFCSQRKI